MEVNRPDREDPVRRILRLLKNGECTVRLGNGNAVYRMNRGSFRTRDCVRRKKLGMSESAGNRVVYGGQTGEDGKTARVEFILEEGDPVVLHIKAYGSFNRFELTFPAHEGEHFYGCGEQYTHLDLQGKRVPVWVSEHQQTLRIAAKLLRTRLLGPHPEHVTSYRHHQSYASYPLFLSDRGYGMCVHTGSYGTLTFGKKNVTLRFRGIPESIALFSSDSLGELLGKAAFRVGISPKLPSWVGKGAILAVQGGTDAVREKYRKAKEAGVPVSAIWSQDWCGNVVTSFGYQVFWNWELDRELYHDFDGLLRELAADGVRFLGYINTFLKENGPQYLEAKEKGFLVKKTDGSVYHIKSTTFDAGIVDLTNPEAARWYGNIIREKMIGAGLSGFMADFGEYLPTDAVVAGGDAAELHNEWPTMWAKCCREAIQASGKEDEIFMFSRAAHTHTAAYTNSVWNGDQHVDYSDEYGLGSVIPASLSLACSGVGVTHSDIGGYTTVLWMKRDAELFLRWSEMNAFSPVFRTHEGNRPADNVQFDDEAVLSGFAAYARIFRALKPYRDSVEEEYQKEGLPMMRPLFSRYGDERSRTEQKEYLFGADVLVAPVLRPGETEHAVYLPEDRWVQFFTGKTFGGGSHTVPSPLGLPVAFYRAESAHADLFRDISEHVLPVIQK